MGITFAVVGLTYLIILVVTYVISTCLNMEETQSEIIVDKAYYYAFGIFVIGLAIVYVLLAHPHVPIDHHTASYLILASKFISAVTLAGSLYFLSKKGSSYKT